MIRTVTIVKIMREYRDRIAEHEDFKDAMYSFRNKMMKEVTEIYHSIAELKQELEKIKETL